VQVFGDGAGKVVALGERDCSLQRRNQKVVEETPAPGLPPATREALLDAAVRLASAANYRSAGTVEFLYDADRDDFFFLEVNTRLQVEHGVTEQVTGVDLVEWMVRGAAGDFAFLDVPPPEPKGASIQVRLYAEDPAQDYRPSSGVLTRSFSRRRPRRRLGGRRDRGQRLLRPAAGQADRHRAGSRGGGDGAAGGAGRHPSRRASRPISTGCAPWSAANPFVTGEVSTRALETVAWTPDTIQVLSGGPATTVQDWPGRQGYWDVGVPPSGPMDASPSGWATACWAMTRMRPGWRSPPSARP
jgi:urea carboxylase